jgi:hypothetical protein
LAPAFFFLLLSLYFGVSILLGVPDPEMGGFLYFVSQDK